MPAAGLHARSGEWPPRPRRAKRAGRRGMAGRRAARRHWCSATPAPPLDALRQTGQLDGVWLVNAGPVAAQVWRGEDFPGVEALLRVERAADPAHGVEV